MRWQGERESENVEDQRGSGGGSGGAWRPRPLMASGGIGTLILVVIVVLMGGDPKLLLKFLGAGGGWGRSRDRAPWGGAGGAPRQPDAREEELKKFVSVVLADTEDVWNKLFEELGQRLLRAEVGAVLGASPIRVRICRGGDGAVLLR